MASVREAYRRAEKPGWYVKRRALTLDVTSFTARALPGTSYGTRFVVDLMLVGGGAVGAGRRNFGFGISFFIVASG